MEVWSRIARFIPFSQRFETFHALTRLGWLPRTHTTPSNALLQFCSEADVEERQCMELEEESRIQDAAVVDQFVDMGFPRDRVVRVLFLLHGNIDSTLTLLLSTSFEPSQTGSEAAAA